MGRKQPNSIKTAPPPTTPGLSSITPSPVRVLLRFADALLAAPATNETTTTRHTTHKWSCSNDFYRVSFEAAAVAKVYGVVASPGRFVVVVVVISIAPLSLCDHS